MGPPLYSGFQGGVAGDIMRSRSMINKGPKTFTSPRDNTPGPTNVGLMGMTK